MSLSPDSEHTPTGTNPHPGPAARAERVAASLRELSTARRAEHVARLALDDAKQGTAERAALARRAGATWEQIGETLGVSGVQAYRIARSSGLPLPG